MTHIPASRIKYLGGLVLGLGLLWFGLSSPRPGWRALSEALPDWIINVQGSLAFAALGLVLTVLGDRVSAHVSKSSNKMHDNIGRDHPKTSEGFSHNDKSTDAQSDEEQNNSEDFAETVWERVALRPCWPQHATSSWVGGMPKLPAQTDWPMIGTRPAVFMAQISLADLPEAIWNGMGPRTGWLVFWVGDDEVQRRAKTIVQHVTGPVQERCQPPGVVPNWHRTMVPEGLEAALGEAGRAPARWYLEQVNGPALGAVEDMMSEKPSFYDEDLGEWIWEPTWTSKVNRYLDQVVTQDEIRNGVDWPSLRGMVRIWQQTALEDISGFERTIAGADEGLQRAQAPLLRELQLLKDNPSAERAFFEDIERQLSIKEAKFTAQIDSVKALLKNAKAAVDLVEKVEAEIGALEQETGFTPKLGKDLLDKLNSKYPATSQYTNRDTQYFMENYARYRYTMDPDSVPDVLLTLFAPLWELQCQETLIFVGRSLKNTDGTQVDARLIDIPPHPLAGLTFGDNCRFYSDLARADLIEGNWLKASATVHYG